MSMHAAERQIDHAVALLLDEAPAVSAGPKALPSRYYVHNFRTALASLRQSYGGLLGTDETEFLQQFDRLTEPAQCLLTRLIMRKGPLFRAASLHYPEIDNLKPATEELVALGWLDPDPALSAADLLHVLQSDDLRLAVGLVRRRQPAMRASQSAQLPLPLQDHPSPHRTLANWHPSLAGTVIQLRIGPLIKRLQLLFFGNHHQSWAEFVLADLGVTQYESVVLDAQARAFTSREEISHFFRLHDCRERLDAGESARVVREAARMPTSVCSWLRAKFVRLNVRIGEMLAADGEFQLALQAYRECDTVAGLVSAVRLQAQLGLKKDAQRDALLARELSCSEAQQDILERALQPGKRKVARRACCNTGEGTAVIELTLRRPAAPMRIELTVAKELGKPDAPLFFVENSLMSSLFGLLCWEALFAPVQGAFFHPFQAAPADLYTAEFRARRARYFDNLLGLLDTGQHEGVIRRFYRDKAGIRTNFVHWGKLRPRLLGLALRCIPAAHLRICFERMLDDLKENSTGLPDLIQFRPVERSYRLIEVKGPGDRLKSNQRRWLKFFAAHAIPAVVCKVRWQTQS